MKHLTEFVVRSFVGGLVIVVPIYLSVLLLLKAMQVVAGLVKPIAKLLPRFPAEQQVLSLVLVLVVCCLIGVAARTRAGQAVRERIEKSFFQRIPGYVFFRSLTKQLAGSREERLWKPALAEIEEA